MEKKLAPSLLSADFLHLEEDIRAIERAGVEVLHLDVMDGNYVPNISFGPGIIRRLRDHTDLFFDCHMMVNEPIRFLSTMKQSGCQMLTVHAEACRHLHRTIQEIHISGMQAGVALNPATPLDVLQYVLDEIDLILIMTVNPGFGGQKLIPQCLTKIRDAKTMIERSGRDIILEADGGIGASNIEQILHAGCDWAVAGSAVFLPGKTEENAKELQEIVNYAHGL